MQVIKRDGTIESFNEAKVYNAVKKAFMASHSDLNFCEKSAKTVTEVVCGLLENSKKKLCVEEIQDIIQNALIGLKCSKTAIVFAVYREKHKELRLIKDRADYIEKYSTSNENAATSSEIDGNANIQNKNVATLEAELYKTFNTDVSRYRIVKKLKELYGVSAPDYIKDLNSKTIYKHDEGSAPAIKPYCVAVNLYPFMQRGTATLDRLGTKAPQNLDSFTGQFGNLAFLLSSQFQGAVAFGEFFNVIAYYCIKEWGEFFYMNDYDIVQHSKIKHKTISDTIEQAFQNIVYTINQPAGNRSYQSPFTNISYYDKNYWEALFSDFVYPDGTKPSWEAVDYLQKKFMRWFNAERQKCLLTFPVETVAMLSDGNDIIDKDYKEFVAEMYAAGHSFFTYISDNADSLSSCCRLKNKLEKNEFSFTSGLTGVATGSKSVITLNLNRIIQDFMRLNNKVDGEYDPNDLKRYLSDILDRVYKYHTAYNELLWDLYDNKMMPVYSEGYISLNQQFLTIGINGLNEAAEFIGIKINDNKRYQDFCNLITSTIGEQNRLHEDIKSKHHLKFNCEFVPAESLAIKNYQWDKEDGYWIPEDRNCYNSYFYKPDDESVSVLEKFRLHGKKYVESLDGGVALHCNLEEHLSQEQYRLLIEYAVKEGTNYFTFNIPNSQCAECGHISKHKLSQCPQCGSDRITWWTRIIGYLRPISNFSKGRRVEAGKRVYSQIIE
ncbi:anaerobic ribonucleoside-triphosphate reductase [Bacteroides sp. 224]|uniref:anaerobic ribonucleoside-triphosphate reductase n=1 Tax=Bacteroides sp. 224 TaxID=2302936 RepID=UPI0013CF5F81|nr:anaerobic ribonucleoside-triphosphate reductase [Bacteroides sp. 224]NDV63930.1 anaerobic ribonucleoside-triphosphate reductase [Bacteroides sp. 224]